MMGENTGKDSNFRTRKTGLRGKGDESEPVSGRQSG